MSGSKVFGIGLARTGTTSVYQALRILGYSAIDFPLGLRGVEEHEAATDIPIADSFEFLDRKYPGSKFIYTVRQLDDWIRSCKAHWARYVDAGRGSKPETEELLMRLYGTVDFDERLFIQAYTRHERRVLSYFSGRSQDILTLDICSGRDGWVPLCTFLGREVPKHPFPHVNRTKKPLEYRLDSAGKRLKIFKKSIKKSLVNRVSI